MQSPQYIGVYSLRNKLQGGSKALYFVWQTEAGDYIVQRIDSARKPVGVPERVAHDVLLQNFVPEAPTPPQPVMPEEDAPGRKTDAAQGQDTAAARKTPEKEQVLLFPPQEPAGKPEDTDDDFRRLELARKAKQLEAAMRDTFRKTLLRLKRPKERTAALAALEQMAAASEGVTTEHRHMFRDFGVQLRKQSMPETALHFSRRVVSLAPGDDHALFNLARILCELRQFNEAEKLLAQAMQIDRTEPVYRLLRDYIMREKRRKPPRSR